MALRSCVGVAPAIWAAAVGVIMSGWITLEDIDFFHRLDFHKLDGQG